MPEDTYNLKEQLLKASIFGPDSNECSQQEQSLSRYFEKEYKHYLKDPVSLQSIGISSELGPIMEETDDLMQQHYDENIDLFNGFLDTSYHAYTMAYYGENGDSDITLEQAQYDKFQLFVERAQIKGDENILNIGCGFGSLETFLLKEYPNIKITGITPSQTQIRYLQEKIQENGHPLSNNFSLIEGDINHLTIDAIGRNRYDLVISVGVCEHVLNMSAFMELIANLLKPDGKTFHHFITSKTAIPQLLKPNETRIGNYFPGGRVWPHDEFSRHTKLFDLEGSWFVNGNNYWRTLDEWHHRYWKTIPELFGTTFDIAAIKHWNDYFSLCKSMFKPLDGSFYGNSQYLFRLKS